MRGARSIPPQECLEQAVEDSSDVDSILRMGESHAVSHARLDAKG